MEISMELQKRISTQNANREKYRYNGEQSLAGKTLTRIVAPSAVGKSTIVNHILEIANKKGIDAAEVGTVTTRPGRPNDPSNYKTSDDGITHDHMAQQIENGELVSWSLFETGHLYATAPESYPATYNFLPCLPDSLPMQNKAGFGAVRTFYIVTSIDVWNEQLQERLGPGFKDRLEEAMSSLEYSQKSQAMHKFVSLPGKESLTKTAERILNHTMHDKSPTRRPGMVYEPIEIYTKDEDFDRHCRDLYRLAMLLSREENTQNTNHVDDRP